MLNDFRPAARPLVGLHPRALSGRPRRPAAGRRRLRQGRGLVLRRLPARRARRCCSCSAGARSPAPQLTMLRAAAVAGALSVLVIPIFSAFRLELVCVPMAAFGLGLGAERLAERAGRALLGANRPLRRPKSPAPSRRSGPRDPLRAEFVQDSERGRSGSHSFEERMRAARPLILAAPDTGPDRRPRGGAGPVDGMPLHRLRAGGRAAGRRPPGSADRGGDEVPLRRGRLHHGAALLQAAEQHGHARRAPLDEHGPAARRGRVHGRDRVGLAGGGAAHAGADHAGHHLHHLLPLEPGTLRLQRRVLLSAASTARRCTLRPTRVSGGNGVYHYGASGFPDSTFNATNYWVDAVFNRLPPADTRAPRVSATSPAAGAIGVAAELERSPPRSTSRSTRSP